jgi:hypothetical protein
LAVLVAPPHLDHVPTTIENQSDGLDSRTISSIELSRASRQHLTVEEAAILMISKTSLSETLMWHGALDRRAGLRACYPREMRRSLKPMPENAKIARAQPLTKTLEAIDVYQPGLDAETIRPLRRRPEVADQTKPHRLAALWTIWLPSSAFISG